MDLFWKIMIAGAALVAIGWIAYGIWDWRERKLEKEQPKVRSEKYPAGVKFGLRITRRSWLNSKSRPINAITPRRQTKNRLRSKCQWQEHF